jgi:anti-sigma28 factor (negative regulator of flagellin synthesis)
MEQPDPEDHCSSSGFEYEDSQHQQPHHQLLHSPAFTQSSNYDPFTSPSRHRPHASQDIDEETADAFYRPYSTQSINLPDILIHDENQTMPPKRKPVGSVGANGAATRVLSASPPTTTSSRAASRSTSGPTSLSAQKQSTVPKGSTIKERVKQLEQANSSGTRSVSTSHTPKSAAKLQKLPTRDKIQNGTAFASSRKRDKNTASRQPLFGEVTGANGTGYGIPSLMKQRSNLETSMPRSSNSSRSQSRLTQTKAESHILT